MRVVQKIFGVLAHSARDHQRNNDDYKRVFRDPRKAQNILSEMEIDKVSIYNRETRLEHSKNGGKTQKYCCSTKLTLFF